MTHDPDKTPQWDPNAPNAEPDPYLRIVADVLAACDRKQAPIDDIRGRAELIRVGLVQTSNVRAGDRASDIEAAFKLLDDARKAGMFE